MRNTLLVGLSLLLVAACGSDRKGTGDAPVGKQDNVPAQIIKFPDEYPNVAFKCYLTNGIYVSTHGKGDFQPMVVPNDPLCKSPG